MSTAQAVAQAAGVAVPMATAAGAFLRAVASERKAKAAELRAQAAELAAATAAANCPGNPPARPLGYPAGRAELLGALPTARHAVNLSEFAPRS
jgi:hypothetical protein